MKILDVPRSGSYQGITSSRNRFGQYVRTRATPVNPASTFQTAVRARLQTAAADWRNLTAAQREAWSALGEFFQRTDSLGQTYFLTGFQTFVSVNNNLRAAGDSALTDAPLYAPPDPVLSVTPTLGAAAMSIAYTPTPLSSGERAFIFMSPPRSAGVTFEGDMRLIVVTAAAAASPANVFSAWTARFGTPVVGQRVFVSVQRYKGGFVSTPFLTTSLVA